MEFPEDVISHTIIGKQWQFVHFREVEMFHIIYSHFESVELKCMIYDCFCVLRCLHVCKDYIHYSVHPVNCIVICVVKEACIITLFES